MALCRQVDGLEILVSTLRSQTFCPAVFTKHGIDVTQYRLVGLKSSSHFRAGFRDVASEIITCDAMGLTTKRPVSPAPCVAALEAQRHKGTMLLRLAQPGRNLHAAPTPRCCCG